MPKTHGRRVSSTFAFIRPCRKKHAPTLRKKIPKKMKKYQSVS